MPEAGPCVCFRADCRQVAAERERMLPFAFEHYLEYRSRCIRASIERENARVKIEDALRNQERDENRGFWHAKLKELPGFRPGRYPLAAIPSCRRKIVNLSEKRRRRFRDRLNRILSGAQTERLRLHLALSNPPEPGPAEPAPNPIITQVCAVCAGGCCTRGGDHAYLTRNPLLGLMKQRPDIRPRDILDTYLGYLQTKIYADSCIFHARKGCALPRSLRSTTCTSYFCQGLEGLITALDSGKRLLGAFVIVRSREPWDALDDESNRIDRSFILTVKGSKPV